MSRTFCYFTQSRIPKLCMTRPINTKAKGKRPTDKLPTPKGQLANLKAASTMWPIHKQPIDKKAMHKRPTQNGQCKNKANRHWHCWNADLGQAARILAATWQLDPTADSMLELYCVTDIKHRLNQVRMAIFPLTYRVFATQQGYGPENRTMIYTRTFYGRKSPE